MSLSLHALVCPPAPRSWTARDALLDSARRKCLATPEGVERNMHSLASLRSLPGASHGKLMIVTATTVVGLVAPAQAGVSRAELQAPVGMAIFQAAHAFALLTGRAPDVGRMRQYFGSAGEAVGNRSGATEI